MKKNKAVSATSTKHRTYNPTQRRNAAKSIIADDAGKVKGGKTETRIISPVALYEDWQKHAFAVGFTTAVRLLTK